MKKIIFFLFLLPLFAHAQLGKNNIIKTNLSGYVFNNYYFTYERKIVKHLSLSLSYRTMPKGIIPFESQVSKMFKNSNFDFTQFQIGNTAITPEVRIYSHKNMTGFYIAGYARFATFDITAPVNYTYTNGAVQQSSTALFDGKITSTSGGLMIGTQHNLFKILVLDIWILGGHYGTCNGTLLATINHTMSSQEQAALQNQINGIQASPFTITGKVTSPTTANLVANGPWAGIRAGLNLGIRF